IEHQLYRVDAARDDVFGLEYDAVRPATNTRQNPVIAHLCSDIQVHLPASNRRALLPRESILGRRIAANNRSDVNRRMTSEVIRHLQAYARMGHMREAWPNPAFLEMLGIELPIIQAPMAGSQLSAMTIAVCEAGGLGSLPCAMLTAEQVRSELTAIRRQT